MALREKGFEFAGGSSTEVEKKFPYDSMTFKTYVGSSAGSVITTFLASGYDVDAVVVNVAGAAGDSGHSQSA